ncbi:MAG: LysR substrate-binding domain-containing protein [Pigmentiphaga sp.]|uniref:LysR substrate-binding domain-containing protein n=1 Tax=Pigmentiphaga sp. TaxID=1977564 RepID=UPI0029A6C547|nr:LysR substrate-binding domain-containing protein [Pigmentiphaga sp.]MDX3905795.1 LysR substrate-binding domain-containing protein [Pigmentiphaga sp.]
MRRKIPSPVMLQAFELSARTLSFTQAADSMNLTQSAISHQIQALEEFLGVRLFERVRKRLQLTPAGEILLLRLTPALDALESAIIETVSTEPASSVLRLGVVPSVATQWLIPRLGHFQRVHPDVSLTLVTRLPFNFHNNSLDAAINLGNTRWPGARSDWLMDEYMLVVCTPEMAATELHSPADLTRVPKLQMTFRPHAWRDWLAACDLPADNAARGMKFESFALILRAAMAGLGAAVVPRLLVEEELADGRLVSPFGPVVRSPTSYYLVYPPANVTLPALQTFRDWLKRQTNAPAEQQP